MDIVREGYDCIVRVGALSDSSLIQRKLTELERGTFASPSYLTKFGTPATPEDLENGHRMVDMLAPNMPSVAPLAFQIDGRVRTMLLLTVIHRHWRGNQRRLGLRWSRHHPGAAIPSCTNSQRDVTRPEFLVNLDHLPKDLVAGLALPLVFVFDLGRGDDALRQTQKGLRFLGAH